jgi:hypothetical protein
LHIRDFGISTAPHPGAYYSAAVVDRNFFSYQLRERMPIAGRKARIAARVHSARFVLQARRSSAQLIELRERGV